MNRFVVIALVCFLILGNVIAAILYRGESHKNTLLRSETSKTIQASSKQIKTLKTKLKEEADLRLQDKKTLLEQITNLSREREVAEADLKKRKEDFEKEKAILENADKDLKKTQAEVARLRRDRTEMAKKLSGGFSKKKREYATRVLDLEAQLQKNRFRIKEEGSRDRYNLGVMYVGDKDYEQAVIEFLKSLEYNPDNPLAHYNLGIVYEEYFQDERSAAYHYRKFIELSPDSDDAIAVKEWLRECEV